MLRCSSVGFLRRYLDLHLELVDDVERLLEAGEPDAPAAGAPAEG